VPSAQRIAWTGVKQSGVQVSQLVGSVGFPLLAAWIGWHGASLVGAVAAGVLGLAAVRMLAAVPLLAQDAPPRAAEAAPVPTTAGGSTRSMILALTVFGFINGMGVQATNVYLPLFAVRELDFSL